MTPKDKAAELVVKFRNTYNLHSTIYVSKQNAIGLALLIVDEMLKVQNCLYLYNTGKAFVNHTTYWIEVKKEIEKYD